MDENDGLTFKKRSLGDLMGHFASDLQGGQCNYGPYSQNHMQPAQRVGHCYPHESVDSAIRNQRSYYFPENYAASTGPQFLFNHNNEFLPMVDVGGVNYVVYGTPNSQRGQNIRNVTNMHFMKKTNGTLSGFNDYGLEYPGPDYNLMRGYSPQNNSLPQYQHHDPEPNCKTQLLENLVGNWASDQSGTYSPFGSSQGGKGTLDSENISVETGNKKPRIVAEVRPMRPSYSDVLSKSIISHPKPSKSSQDFKQKPADVKTKSWKSSYTRTLSGNANVLNRQHSTGVDDSTVTNLNSSLNKNIYKKADIYNEENLSKKWASFDDLKETNKQDEYVSFNNVKNKKNNAKNLSSNKQNSKKEKLDSVQIRNGENTNDKIHVHKKQEKAKQSGCKKEEHVSHPKAETIKTKTSLPEERRGTSVIQNKTEQQKLSRPNVRTSPSEKHKKPQKSKRKEQDPCISVIVKQRVEQYGGLLLLAIKWLLKLVLDVLALSTNLAIYMCCTVLEWSMLNSILLFNRFSRSVRKVNIFKMSSQAFRGLFRSSNSKKNKSKFDDDSEDSAEAKLRRNLMTGLQHNISLPETGDEAIKRLLQCKGHDPYSILGVTKYCTDDDIKKYYKRQAFLVHPDKNNQPGSEEAFKILVHAFNLIGKPELRKMYDEKMDNPLLNYNTWTRINEYVAQIRKKNLYFQNTIKCSNCKKRHKRTIVDRPIYAARVCAQCKIHHAAREGDIWAETNFFGLFWQYFACMDGAVYDVTEWGRCQGKNLRNLKANTHNVQYRRVHPWQQGPSKLSVNEFYDNYYSKSEAQNFSSFPYHSFVSSKKRKGKGKK